MKLYEKINSKSLIYKYTLEIPLQISNGKVYHKGGYFIIESVVQNKDFNVVFKSIDGVEILKDLCYEVFEPVDLNRGILKDLINKYRHEYVINDSEEFMKDFGERMYHSNKTPIPFECCSMCVFSKSTCGNSTKRDSTFPNMYVCTGEWMFKEEYLDKYAPLNTKDS